MAGVDIEPEVYPPVIVLETSSCCVSGDGPDTRITLAEPGVNPLRPKITTGSPGRSASNCAAEIPNSPSFAFAAAGQLAYCASPMLKSTTESPSAMLLT